MSSVEGALEIGARHAQDFIVLAVVLDANTVGVQEPLAGNASRIVLDAASKGQLLV